MQAFNKDYDVRAVFGEWVKLYREKLNLKQAQLEKSIKNYNGKSISISSIENGREIGTINFDTIDVLSKVLDVQPHMLFMPFVGYRNTYQVNIQSDADDNSVRNCFSYWMDHYMEEQNLGACDFKGITSLSSGVYYAIRGKKFNTGLNNIKLITDGLDVELWKMFLPPIWDEDKLRIIDSFYNEEDIKAQTEKDNEEHLSNVLKVMFPNKTKVENIVDKPQESVAKQSQVISLMEQMLGKLSSIDEKLTVKPAKDQEVSVVKVFDEIIPIHDDFIMKLLTTLHPTDEEIMTIIKYTQMVTNNVTSDSVLMNFVNEILHFDKERCFIIKRSEFNDIYNPYLVRIMISEFNPNQIADGDASNKITNIIVRQPGGKWLNIRQAL